MANKEPNSTTKSDMSRTPQNPKYSQKYPQPFESDTIDLYEIWITFWNNRWILIGVTIISALGSVVFALSQPSIYKAQVLLLMPSQKDVQSLNVKGIPGISAEKVFVAFKNNLISRNLQKKSIRWATAVTDGYRLVALRDISFAEFGMIYLSPIKRDCWTGLVSIQKTSKRNKNLLISGMTL